MEKFKALVEDGTLFLIMSIFSVMKQMIGTDEKMRWGKAGAKVFINLIAGVSFYSFLLSHRSWYGDWPQKIGIVMVSVYIGSRLIDIIVDKFFVWLKKASLKEIIRKLFDL